MPAAKKSLASRAEPVVGRAVTRSGSENEGAAETGASDVVTPAAKEAPAKKAPAKRAAAKKAAPATAPEEAAVEAPAKKRARRGSAAALVVRDGESPWTADELGEVRKHLRADVTRLEPELEHADAGLHDLMIDSGDGSGQDQADMGSSTFERDHELSIANNAREMLDQSRHALERIEDGTFGVCEGCGEPIGKLRSMAFPRATLCMTCKQREERR